MDAREHCHAPDTGLGQFVLFDSACTHRILRLAGSAKDTIGAFLKGHVVAFLQLVFLLHQAMLSLDAIWRSVLRVFVTKKRLLEWETAAEAEDAKRRTSTVDVYLAWSPLIAAAITGLVWLARPAALPVASPILALWFMARFLSAWLNRAPRTGHRQLNREDVEYLRAVALRTWRYFREWSGPKTNWLIPDNVREDGASVPRLSPTNLGFLFDVRIAAVHFGYSRFLNSQPRRPRRFRRFGTFRNTRDTYSTGARMRVCGPWNRVLYPLWIVATLSLVCGL